MDLGFDEFSEDEIRLFPLGADDEFRARDLAGGDIREGFDEIGGFRKGFGGNFDPDEDAGGAPVVFEGFDIAVEDDFALLHDADVGADVFEIPKDVGADDDGFPHTGEFLKDLANLDACARVEAGGGFVENEEAGGR